MPIQTAVLLGDRSLSVVAGRAAAKGVELTHAATAALPQDYQGLDAEAQTAALRTALAAAGAGHKCVLVVPRHLAILRTFTIPAGSPEELQSMIRFQLEKDLPLPLDLVRYAYDARPDEGKIAVTAAAVPNDALNPRILALEKAGMHVVGAVVTSFGLIRLLPGSSDGGSLLLSLADGGAEILIADSGKIQLSRNTPFKEQDSDSWAAEIDRAILSHGARGSGSELKRVFVAGEGQPAEGVASELKRRIRGADVAALVPNGLVTRRPDVKISAECAATAGVVVGMLSPGSTVPDLLRPHAIRRTLKVSRTNKIVAAVALGVVGVVVLSQVLLANRRSEAAELRRDVTKLKPKSDSVDKMQAEIKVLSQWQDRRFAWIDLLEQLRRRLPAGKIHLSSLAADEAGVVRLSGKAKDNASAIEFATELGKMGRVFREVGSPTIRLNSDKNEFKHDFDIRVTLADLAPPLKKPPQAKK